MESWVTWCNGSHVRFNIGRAKKLVVHHNALDTHIVLNYDVRDSQKAVFAGCCDVTVKMTFGLLNIKCHDFQKKA